ncbi:alpha-N-acetylgalactosaminide alpha-2,6-sialyltransferase 2-like [Branchiostoma floridae x Branchiostoma japonicum]
MGRHKSLFLLCLLLALGFVLLSGSYLRKTMVELGVVSYWKTRTYENLTSSKDQVKANALITTNPPETVMTITQRGTSIHELNNDKTYLSDSLVVGTRWDRRVATPTPGETGTTAPPTTPPDKRGPTWFLRDDTYTKSKCPSAIRKNPEKVLKFIPDIPILMWNDHINPEEYTRLQQFKENYGWKDMSYEDIENCLRHFNTSAHRYMFPGWTPDHTGCIRCAVVGNGGILRGSGKGEEIDGHDFVWRVNAAITKDFEDDVGKRTSFYFHCVNSMMRSVSSAHQYGFRHPPQNKDTVYVSVSKGRRDYEYMDAAISWRTITSGIDKAHDPPYEYGVKPANTKFRMLHPDFTRYLKYQ